MNPSSYAAESTSFARRVSVLRAFAQGLCIALAFALTGCISAKHYVDPGYASVRAADIRPPKSPQPVQLFFEFQNKAGTSASVTDRLKPRVVTFLSNSRCFTQVTTDAQPGATALFLTMTNFSVEGESPTAKGVGVGLTFGLIGAMVTDGYRFEASYRSGQAAPVVRTYQHAMHSTIGNKDGPPGLTPLSTPDAVNTILDQMLTKLLIDLFSDPSPTSL